jgi:hypothetical protein
MNINRTILIEQSRAPLARALAAGLAPGGAGMFQTPVYNKATQALAYYVSSGQIGAEWDALLPLENATQEQKDAATQAIFAAAQGAVTLAQCADLIANSIVVDCDVEGAYVTLYRLGLTL